MAWQSKNERQIKMCVYEYECEWRNENETNKTWVNEEEQNTVNQNRNVNWS